MTRDEIMKMDGQELCDWLNHVARIPMNPETCLQHRTDIYNEAACAFAARNYVCSAVESMVVWIKTVEDLAKCNSGIADPLDWLRAAAIVILENEK